MPRRIALIFAGFGGGGVERSMLQTAAALLARGYAVDLYVRAARGELATEVPEGCRVVELDQAPLWRVSAQLLVADLPSISLLMKRKMLRQMRCLPSLVQHFRSAPPNAVFSASPRHNLMAIWARRLAGLSSVLVVSQRDQVADPALDAGFVRGNYAVEIIRRSYLRADYIVAVSDGIADDLARVSGIPRDRIFTIYNPVVGPDLRAKAQEPLDHPWFAPGSPPVILGVGRLHHQKDFPMLIKAFARLRSKRPARLVILGSALEQEMDTEYVANLKALPLALGVADDVRFEGFVLNPFSFMARSSIFALSSRNEGLPGALIQAMACGCPVVSTDCVSGPREILDNGRFGPLVQVGDDIGMAAAIESVLQDPQPSIQLRDRAELYSVDRAIDRYLELLTEKDMGTDVPPRMGPRASLGS